MQNLLETKFKKTRLFFISLVSLAIFGCSSYPYVPEADTKTQPDTNYIIGPGDELEIFVWGNAELSTSIDVRPDGKITTRLVEDLPASGKTPTELARAIEEAYSEYVRSAVVSVILDGNPIGVPSQQVRVVGEATEPLRVSYTKHMTLLDLMITVGGLTEFAAGNKSVLIRYTSGSQEIYKLRIEDLLEDGDISANLAMHPGDIVMIPEAWF